MELRYHITSKTVSHGIFVPLIPEVMIAQSWFFQKDHACKYSRKAKYAYVNDYDHSLSAMITIIHKKVIDSPSYDLSFGLADIMSTSTR